MRTKIAFAACSAAALLAVPAMAATYIKSGTTLSTVSGPNEDYKVKNEGAIDGNTTVVLTTDPSDYKVDYTSDDLLSVSGNDGNGFATVFGTGGSGFTTLTIDPQDPNVGFSVIDFNLGVFNTQGNPNFFADISVDVLNGTDVLFEDVLFGKNSNIFTLFGDSGEVFSSITFSGLTTANGTLQNFENIRQVSLDLVPAETDPDPQGAVPEPSTWAMMLLGFGAIGFGMRRRKVATPRVNYNFA